MRSSRRLCSAATRGSPADEAMDHITAAMEGVGEARIQVLLGLPLIPIGPSGRRGQRGIRSSSGRRWTRSCASGSAATRPTTSSTGMTRALLDRFPRDEAIELAVDNAATFYLAGHETTANATAWTLFLLSEQPELQEQAAAEAACGAGRGRSMPTFPTGCRCCVRSSKRACGSIRRCRASTARRSPPTGSASMRSSRATSCRSGRGSPPPSQAVGRARRVRSASASRRGQGRAPPLPVLPFGGGPQDLRRRPPRDGRGADHPRHLAQLLAVRARARATSAGSGMVTLRPERRVAADSRQRASSISAIANDYQ